MILRLTLIILLMPLQSCSNTLIGEKLENSFDVASNQKSVENTINEKSTIIEIKKNKLTKNIENSKSEIPKQKRPNENSIQSKDKFTPKSTRSIKKVVFNPQPYRIILKLSGANPSAPAETVTNALRKAGVQFEVEKIERFDEANLLKNTSIKR